MIELDNAVAALKANPEDNTAKMDFYGRFFTTIFFVPIKKVIADESEGQKALELPLIIDHEGSDFLVFFDEKERLNAWAKEDVPFAQMPGFALVEISSPEISWAMNVGTDYDKQFGPEEIAWLKGIIQSSLGQGPAA